MGESGLSRYETPDDTSAARADIGALLGGALPAGLQDKVAGIRKDQSEATTAIADKTDKTLDQDLNNVHRKYAAEEATGLEAKAYPKWNADEEHKKMMTDPLEAFGSLGSVAGILASAFVHAPIGAAFDASAAAINSIKAGDEKAYERAHTAWKENLDLAFKRHDMMREEYSDAVTMMKTNLAAGEAKFKTSMARFGDKRALALSEAGMDKELYEYLASQNKAVEGLRQIKLEGIEDEIKKKAYDGISKGIDDAAKQAQTAGGQVDPMEVAGRKLEAFNRIYHVEKATPAQQIMGTFFAQHPMASAEEAAAFATKNNLMPYSARGGSDAAIIDALRQEHESAGLPQPTAQEIAEAISKKKPTSGVVTGDRIRSGEVKKYMEDLSQQKNDDGTPKYTQNQIADMGAARDKQLKTEAAAPSGNRVDDIKRREDQIETAMHHIDRAQGLLKKHNAITGIGGSVLRRGETVASVLGSNSTDWHEFESEVATIKQLEPRLLLDASGRPLAGEQELREKIVRGLGAGDTKKITIERFVQLRRDFEDALARTRKRREGGSDSPSSSSAPKNPWDSAPIIKPAGE